MVRRDIDWSSVDWALPDAHLAKTCRCNVKTVAAWRAKVGKPRQHTLTDDGKQKMTEGRKKAMQAGRYAAANAKKSKAMKGVKHVRGDKISASHLAYGEDHPSSSSHALIAPDGTRVQFDNAEFFVRDTPEFFETEDTEVRKKPNGKNYCKAASRLQDVSAGRRPQWKGWYAQ